MKCRDYVVTFLRCVHYVMKEINGSVHIQSVLLASNTNSPKWAKWAFWAGVANLIGQIALVIENLINLKGNGFV